MAQKTSKPKKKTAAKKKVAPKGATTGEVPAKKTAAAKKAPSKKAVKKSAAKTKTATKKKAPAKKQTKTRKSATKKTAQPASTKSKTESSSKKAAVTRSGGKDKKATPIVFSLDDVEALVQAKSAGTTTDGEEATASSTPETSKPSKPVDVDQPVEKRKHGAASLADILGFNPGAKKKDTHLEEEEIPKKWKKYYRLLIELRQHVREELDLHTADTLKHSSREDSGDLSSYGNHQADAGTETFDRDFALSLVSSEQDALNEIEEAILRIKNGSYGTCEVTGQPISKERLTAVPFARFSVEGQAEYEKNKRRKSNRAAGGLFGDTSDAPKLTSDDEEED